MGACRAGRRGGRSGGAGAGCSQAWWELERALLHGHVSKAQADALRGGHRATTRLLLEILVSRQQFERSAGFSRSGWQNLLRALAIDPEQVLQSRCCTAATREYLFGKKLQGSECWNAGVGEEILRNRC